MPGVSSRYPMHFSFTRTDSRISNFAVAGHTSFRHFALRCFSTLIETLHSGIHSTVDFFFSVSPFYNLLCNAGKPTHSVTAV